MLRDSPAFDDRAVVVQRVGVWRARGKAPLAATATAQFFQAEAQLLEAVRELDTVGNKNIIEGEPGGERGGGCSKSSSSSSSCCCEQRGRRCRLSPDVAFVRHAVALVVVRFVNGVCDSQQAKNPAAHARSVAEVARSLHVPRVLVDVRHSATHNQLPTVPLLRMCLAEGLAWVREFYWKKQMMKIDGNRFHVAAQLCEYSGRNLVDSEDHVRRGIVRNVKELRRSAKTIVAGLRHRFGSRVVLRDILIPVLLDGYVERDSLSHSLASASFLVPISNNGATSEPSSRCSSFSSTSSDGRLQRRWEPLLVELQRCWPAFSVAMLWQLLIRLMANIGDHGARGTSRSSLSNQTNVHDVLLAWLDYFLQARWWQQRQPPQGGSRSNRLNQSPRNSLASTVLLLIEHCVFALKKCSTTRMISRTAGPGAKAMHAAVLHRLLAALDNFTAMPVRDESSMSTSTQYKSANLERIPFIMYARAIVAADFAQRGQPDQRNVAQQAQQLRDGIPRQSHTANQVLPGQSDAPPPAKLARRTASKWRRCRDWAPCPIGVTAIQAAVPNLTLSFPKCTDSFLSQRLELSLTAQQPQNAEEPPDASAQQPDKPSINGARGTFDRPTSPSPTVSLLF